MTTSIEGFTEYEPVVVPLIPMPAHPALDAMSGLPLAASPWIFGFAEFLRMPHVILGLLEVVAAMFTRPRPISRPPAMAPPGPDILAATN